jgi:hypothetical protein
MQQNQHKADVAVALTERPDAGLAVMPDVALSTQKNRDEFPSFWAFFDRRAGATTAGGYIGRRMSKAIAV